MRALSSWWRDGSRIHIAGSFGEIGLTVVPEHRLVTLDNLLADFVVRLVERRDRDLDGLQYFLFWKVRRTDATNITPEIELGCLEAADRALAEAIDLSQRDLFVCANKPLHGDFKFGSEKVDKSTAELVELPSGIALVHRVISYERRLRYRARAAARSQFIDDLLATRSTRRPGFRVSSRQETA